eukprot:Pgem_evm1s13987
MMKRNCATFILFYTSAVFNTSASPLQPLEGLSAAVQLPSIPFSEVKDPTILT